MSPKLDCLQLINFIERSNLFITNAIRHKKILIAFSGGQDSSCLLAIFYILRKKWEFDLGIVYCNHCWKDSIQTSWKIFQILQKYNLPFYFVEAPNSEAMKPEEKARNWRHSSFYHILKKEGYDFVLTGHSLSDCSETVIFNLIRGSGLKGLFAFQEYQFFQIFKKEQFFFKKTTFFMDSTFVFSKAPSNYPFLKKNGDRTSNRNSRFSKPKGLPFFFKNLQSTVALKTKLPGVFQVSKLSIQMDLCLFNRYRQRLEKFQKIDSSSSLISYFKPTNKNSKICDRLISASFQKLISKKEKEKRGRNILKTSFQNQFRTKPIPFQSRFKDIFPKVANQKSSVLSNFPIPNLQSKKKPLFLNNLQKGEFLIFRPLLKINRETLFLFSVTLKLPIYYDQSNKNLNLTRNWIRKLIMPLLKKINPRAEENIYKFSRILEFYYDVAGNKHCPAHRLEIFRS